MAFVIKYWQPNASSYGTRHTDTRRNHLLENQLTFLTLPSLFATQIKYTVTEV